MLVFSHLYDPLFLHQKYVAERLSLQQISESIFSTKEAARSALKRFKTPVREPYKPHGRNAQIRYGRKYSNNQVLIEPSEQKDISVVINPHSQGMGLRQIARTLTMLKIPTKFEGKAWHPQMIKRILVE